MSHGVGCFGTPEGEGLDIWIPQGTGSVEAEFLAASPGSWKNPGAEEAVQGADDWKSILFLGAGALLCYEATASLFRAVTLHNWYWHLMRSMVCQLREGCEETLLFIETGDVGVGLIPFFLLVILPPCTQGFWTGVPDIYPIIPLGLTSGQWQETQMVVAWIE